MEEINNYFDCSERDKYFKIYNEILMSLDIKSFDSKFIDLYNKASIVVNGEERKLEKLRVRCTDKGIVHFVFSGDNHTDVYTGEKFDDKIVFFCAFRDTTMFHQMYLDGVINNNKINIDKETMLKYAKDWDRKTHVAVPWLKARSEANRIYEEKMK